MTDTARSRRRSGEKGTETTASHSVRTPNDTWAGAVTKAKREGLAINRVIIELLEGYRRGVYKLPKRSQETVRVYPQTTSAAAPVGASTASPE